MKEIEKDLYEKKREIEELKRNFKITKFNEVESDKKHLFEETLRLRDIIIS